MNLVIKLRKHGELHYEHFTCDEVNYHLKTDTIKFFANKGLMCMYRISSLDFLYVTSNT